MEVAPAAEMVPGTQESFRGRYRRCLWEKNAPEALSTIVIQVNQCRISVA